MALSDDQLRAIRYKKKREMEEKYKQLKPKIRKQIKKMCEQRRYICKDDQPFVDEWIMDLEKLLNDEPVKEL